MVLVIVYGDISLDDVKQQPVVTFFVVGIMGVVTTPRAQNGGKTLQAAKNNANLYIILDCALACIVFIGIVCAGYLLGEQMDSDALFVHT